MSIPIQSNVIGSSGVTSPVIGQINYGWISDAWRFFSAQMGVWILATLVLFAPMVIFFIAFYALMWATMFPGGFPPTAQTVPPPGSNPFPLTARTGGTVEIIALEIGFGLLYSLWSAYLYGGLFQMAVQQVRGLPIELKDIFRGGRLFGRMLGAMFLLGFGTYGLEALCAAPVGLLIWQHGPAAAMITAGIIGGLLFFALILALTGILLPSFALIADGDRVIPALKRSAQALKSHWAAASGFVLVLGVLVYASEIPCGIGLLATIPMVFLICALAYRDMLGMPNMAAPPGPVYSQPPSGSWPPPPTVQDTSLQEGTNR